MFLFQVNLVALNSFKIIDPKLPQASATYNFLFTFLYSMKVFTFLRDNVTNQ